MAVISGSIENVTQEFLAEFIGTRSNVGTTFHGNVNVVPLLLNCRTLRVQGMTVTIICYLRDWEGFKLVIVSDSKVFFFNRQMLPPRWEQ